MDPIVFVVAIFFSFIVGLIGKRMTGSFWTPFIAGLFISPLLTFIIVVVIRMVRGPVKEVAI